MTNSTAVTKPIDSDALHNRNCFSYLLKFQPILDNNPKLLKYLPQLTPILAMDEDEYDEYFAYGDLYSTTINMIEAEIESIESGLSSEPIEELDELVHAVYHNDNGIIEQTDWLINPISEETTPKNNPKTQIIKELKDTGPTVNANSPQNADNLWHILTTVYPNYKPQTHTNLPSLKPYSYRDETHPTEYRFSTQAQRHNGAVRISPLFKRWLTILAQQTPEDQKISFVYFNNLGLDRDLPNIPGYLERQLTLELHTLEDDPSLKVAVFTLPAVKGLMDHSDFTKTHNQLDYDSVYNELLEVALGNGHPSGIGDFWISDATKELLFGEVEPKTVLEPLLAKSFGTFGITASTYLSTAQKQAVWLHFIKFELTNYIINTLKPNGYNFSCKDGIDRGAVSSAYFNLMKSFELNKPITKDEFDRALHSAATNARGRGLNFHREIIWNALDAYVNAHYDELIEDAAKSWLIYWRDMNCPHERVSELIPIRLKQCAEHLNDLPETQVDIKQAGTLLLKNIENQSTLSGQRVLLEIVSRTAELITAPSVSEKSIATYTKLANELPISYPYLYILGGLMEAFLGVLLYIPSLGSSQKLITQGIATAKSGFFAHMKVELREEMINYLTEVSPNSRGV